MKTPKRLLTLFTSLLILALVASASIASTRAVTHQATTGNEELAITGQGSGATEGDGGTACDEEGTDEVGTDEDCQEEPNDETDNDEETDEGSDATTDADPDRVAACNEVAGIEPAPEEGAIEDPTTADETDVPEKLYGLDNAIARVLANCLKNAQAPGLLNALEHLVANKAKHDAHETWKAEKAAARAEAKATKHAGSGHGAGHGSAGEHGNPHEDQAHGNPHGVGGNGHGGPHGNGH